MVFWVIWFIGIGITIGTRILINVLTIDEEEIYDRSGVVQIVMHILVMICICLVGGIANAKWLSGFSSSGDLSILAYITLLIVLGGVPAFLTYFVGYWLLGLYHFDDGLSKTIFIATFIISIIGWNLSINEYNRNIEVVNEVVEVQKQERKLLYFCNIPVQEISGEVYGSTIFGSGNVSGDITTSENLPYWYLNENGQGIYDSVSTNTSKLIFIDDNEVPYLQIIDYCMKKITINHNNGKKKSVDDKTWTEYHFYVPEEVMEYNLN